MLDNLAKSVVFTGSQIPFSEVHSDARRNLIVSMIFAGNDDFAEVRQTDCYCLILVVVLWVVMMARRDLISSA